MKRSQDSHGDWISLLTYWLIDRFGIDLPIILESPSLFSLVLLPPFYEAAFEAWRSLGGSCDLSSGAPTYSGGSNSRTSLSGITCKMAYLRFLEIDIVVPHCVEKISPSFGSLCWSSTWSQLFYMPLDRVVIDLSWKKAHGVLYTAECLSSFGYAISTACFCNSPMESAEHLFFHCRLAKSGIDWIQSQLFLAAPLAPSISLRHLLFGSSSDELIIVLWVFVYLLLSRNTAFGPSEMTFAFAMWHLALLVFW